MLSAMKNSPKVFLDAPPISRSIHQLTDYSSYLVYCLCSMPLVRVDPTKNTILPLAAKSWKATNNYSLYEFFLRDDIYWSTGEKVKAIDYCRAINFVLADNGNRYRSLLADIEGYSDVIKEKSNILSGMEFENNIIRFHLKNPNYFFLMYLSLPVFSPLSTISHEIFCGAYTINAVADSEIELKRNEYFEHDAQHKSIDKITFSYQVNESDPFAIEAFNQGEVDVTSDTSFPYEKYSSYAHQKAIMQEYNVDISCTLSENKNTSPELTKLLTYGINRELIIEKLHNVPELNCGYHHLFDRKNRCKHDYLYNKKLALDLSSKIDKSVEITIAYENFYPNLEILNLIAEQLEGLGLRFKFLVEEYGARNINSHFRLELRKSLIPDPLLFYKSASKSKRILTSKKNKEKFFYLLNKYQRTQDENERLFMAMEMDSILIQLGQYVPILKIPGIYLKNPILKNSSLFIPGQFWHV